ncbi:MAG: orotate phosphoribosyltransferase [Gammaproteobacteria bacterium]|jgi:orotate phosphoribosyltransferase|nr:orotate phosphoribosyltransferase [Gammaproteobacteria bacterium]
MQAYKTAFIELALSVGALRFGEFKLKSGRLSPYFFNSGLFASGRAAAELGRCYAAAAVNEAAAYDTLFGPAYKGIPLAALTAAALSDHHGRDVPYCFNRKEAKAHGEGGSIVGAPVSGGVLIVDDVITAGTAIREAIDIILGAGGRPAGVLIALDRQERGTGERSAVQEIAAGYDIPVYSIIQLADLIRHLEQTDPADPRLVEVRAYRDRYGV